MKIPKVQTTRILIIEDDVQIVEALSLSLERLDYTVVAARHDPGDALPEVLAGIDAVVLDIGLPGTDGFGVCRSIRTISDVPIIMLTARSDDIDIVAGLEAGADDYVVKPVSPRVLDARIKAAIRRVGTTPGPDEPTPNVTTVGPLVVDRSAVKVMRDGREISLSPTEVRLVFAFTSHPGQVLSRDQLLELAWDQSYLGDSRLVDNAIQRLRAKIDVAGRPSLIETVRGFGYRFVP